MFKNTSNYRNKIILLSVIQVLLLLAVLVWSVITGQYPLTLKSLLSGDTMSIMVFKRLRLPRALMGVIGGFGLSISGYIYQLIFKNPLASPDIVGVSSGASAGAALAIVAVSASVPVISISAFIGAVTALIITLLTAYLVPGRNSYTIVLAGIAIHSVAQTILMFLKLAADPEKQLASIEYWIMGSLNGISRDSLAIPFFTTLAGFIVIALLYRQVLILSTSEEEAVSLGVNVTSLRFIILMLATLIVSSIICVTGLISFIGLIAPHIARLLTKRNDIFTYITSGFTAILIVSLLSSSLSLPNPVTDVIIMLGTNDCKTVYNASAEVIGQGVERLINQVKSCLPHSRILLVSPIHLGKGVWEQDYDPEFSEASVEVSKKLAGVYSKIAEKESIDFLSASDAAQPSEIDREHLSEQGHKELARNILKWFDI